MNAFAKAVKIVGGPTKMARAIGGVSTQAVCFWRDGKREFPVEYCAVVEELTEGKVTRRDLRPDDWRQIWPELVKDAA